MKYLLDTHILLWSRLQPHKISSPIAAALASPDDTKFVSTVSLWEISLKYQLGKLDLGGHTPEDFLETMYSAGLTIVSPTELEMASSHRLLMLADHKDPFDRLLVWQAINEDMVLLSQDTRLSGYISQGLRLV